MRAVTLVDRREGPGGHWQQAYPFVRLHAPSTYYGVNLPTSSIGGTLTECDRFATPSTSRSTVAAIIVSGSRTKTYIVTRWKTSNRPMLSFSAA